MARALALALDPVLLADAAGYQLDPWQAELLWSRARQLLMLCSRQSGKSTVAALLAVDEALHRAPALVLLLAPALRQSQELYRKVRDLLGALGAYVPPMEQESALSLELATGSRIVCLPGSNDATIRGYSGVRLLVVDEAARTRDDLWGALRPMVAVSRGRIVALSTPWGKRGWFFETWTDGGDRWHRVKVTAAECPRIDPEWLEQERRSIPPFVFASEYECVFTETEDSVFSYETIQAAISPDVTPLPGRAW